MRLTPVLGLLFAFSARAEPAEDDAILELKEHHRHHHHGGVAQFIAMSLDTLGADDTKRPQIEKIQSAFHVCTAPARQQERTLLVALADGIAAGTIDPVKIEERIEHLQAAAASVQECTANALNELYALLLPSERSALADKVQAHWAVWRRVNHEAPPGGKEAGGRLAELGRELSLAPEQLDQMAAALKDALPRASGHFDASRAQEQVEAFANAFASASFDAGQFKDNANGEIAAHGARRMAVFYETVLPLLTPDQRTPLAAHLREHAAHQPPAPVN